MKIHASAVIEDGAEIGDVIVGPYCHVGAGVKLCDGVRLNSHVVVIGDTEIGGSSLVHSFAVLGGAPQHLQYREEQTRLVIGANNTIREHVTINRGTQAGGGITRVGNDGFFMTGSHIAHDCSVGDGVVFANNATLGGHVSVGDHAFLGGLCAVHQHSRVGEYAFVGGCAAVTADIIPFASAVGNHARLVGLNVVGLKRREFSREAIKNLRSAYQMLFKNEQTFSERLEQVRSAHGNLAEVKRVLDFIDSGRIRALMTPARENR